MMIDGHAGVQRVMTSFATYRCCLLSVAYYWPRKGHSLEFEEAHLRISVCETDYGQVATGLRDFIAQDSLDQGNRTSEEP